MMTDPGFRMSALVAGIALWHRHNWRWVTGWEIAALPLAFLLESCRNPVAAFQSSLVPPSGFAAADSARWPVDIKYKLAPAPTSTWTETAAEASESRAYRENPGCFGSSQCLVFDGEPEDPIRDSSRSSAIESRSWSASHQKKGPVN